jgi:hypothetical protein
LCLAHDKSRMDGAVTFLSVLDSGQSTIVIHACPSLGVRNPRALPILQRETTPGEPLEPCGAGWEDGPHNFKERPPQHTCPPPMCLKVTSFTVKASATLGGKGSTHRPRRPPFPSASYLVIAALNPGRTIITSSGASTCMHLFILNFR